MEQTLATWLLPIVGLIAGIAIGYLVARSSAPNRTQRQVDDLQERFDILEARAFGFDLLLRKPAPDHHRARRHLQGAAGGDHLSRLA